MALAGPVCAAEKSTIRYRLHDAVIVRRAQLYTITHRRSIYICPSPTRLTNDRCPTRKMKAQLCDDNTQLFYYTTMCDHHNSAFEYGAPGFCLRPTDTRRAADDAGLVVFTRLLHRQVQATGPACEVIYK